METFHSTEASPFSIEVIDLLPLLALVASRVVFQESEALRLSTTSVAIPVALRQSVRLVATPAMTLLTTASWYV